MDLRDFDLLHWTEEDDTTNIRFVQERGKITTHFEISDLLKQKLITKTNIMSYVGMIFSRAQEYLSREAGLN